MSWPEVDMHTLKARNRFTAFWVTGLPKVRLNLLRVKWVLFGGSQGRNRSQGESKLRVCACEHTLASSASWVHTYPPASFRPPAVLCSTLQFSRKGVSSSLPFSPGPVPFSFPSHCPGVGQLANPQVRAGMTGCPHTLCFPVYLCISYWVEFSAWNFTDGDQKHFRVKRFKDRPVWPGKFIVTEPGRFGSQPCVFDPSCLLIPQRRHYSATEEYLFFRSRYVESFQLYAT